MQTSPQSGPAAARTFDWDHPLLVTAVFLAALGLAYGIGSSYWISTVARTAILALSALSLSFLIGQCGLVSFGHAAPVGLGAYAALITGESGISNVLVVLPLAFLAAAAFSVVTGAVALRTRAVYFIMITLAFGQMAFFIASSLAAYGGDDGMSLAARATLFGIKVLKGDFALALLAIALLGLTLALLQRLRRANWGLVLRGARTNEVKLKALGRDPYWHRLGALGLAGGLAGLSGALLANQVEFVSPAYMSWHISGQMIVMVVLGGAGRLGGAILGAATVTLLIEVLDHWTVYGKLGLGLAIVAVALLRAADLGQLIGRIRRG